MTILKRQQEGQGKAKRTRRRLQRVGLVFLLCVSLYAMFWLLTVARFVGLSSVLLPGLAVSSSSIHAVGAEQQPQEVVVETTGDVQHEPEKALVENNQQQQVDESSILNTTTTETPPDLACGLWMAPSTIPGAGLGVYAGRNFKADEPMQQSGDAVIVITDLRYHTQDNEFNFLWDEYTWGGDPIFVGHEGYSDVEAASPGFGAAVNSFMPLVNVDEWYPRHDFCDLHRKSNPGAGAFTPYHDRRSTAERDIAAGEELFVAYGDHWFQSREHFGPIPLSEDLESATLLFAKYLKVKKSLQEAGVSEETLKNLWETLVAKTQFEDSRVLAAFNHSDPTEFPRLQQHPNLTELRIEQATRPLDWLRKHGTCADHIAANRSTISEAGRGAFATRNIPKGTLVTQMPLIHIANRSRLAMYHLEEQEDYDLPFPNPERGVNTYQLLLNYCFGDSRTTLLLCPYGAMNVYVNHNQTLANVKLQWSNPERGNHHPELLQASVSELEDTYSAKFSMDLIATRDIKEGEEIFMDYGDEWEKAWQDHVKNWKPPPGAENYVSAADLNSRKTERLPTEFDLIENPIPNVESRCSDAFEHEEWNDYYEQGRTDELIKKLEDQYPCDILRYKMGEDGHYLYTVMKKSRGGNSRGMVTDVPREAIAYYDKPYTSDMHLPTAFRHPIGIPEDMLPEAWKNVDQ